MPTTEVQIANNALSNLGHTIFIESLEDEGQEVDLVNLHYSQSIAVVLEAFEWGFARRIVTLGLVTDFTEDTTPIDWYYSYRYPVNTVKVRRIVNGVGRQDPAPPKFEIGSDDTARLVFTNQVDAIVETTKLITDPALYTAMFAEAVSWWLAFKLVPGLAKDKGLAATCFKMYRTTLNMASASDGNEARWDQAEVDSEAIRARD